ncbi:hypothetical protein HMPREF0208_04327 [Citrobacter koseri]|nr:hypothetical protein HMPREF3220_04891 [Citrobacter koseri]KWZ98378.1 hypothetical protein HMPREF3207_04238 [Citrobacter koseri]KXB40455.1 hypothetical protein HMPREF0208_04327 [Citrobacter koseri]
MLTIHNVYNLDGLSTVDIPHRLSANKSQRNPLKNEVNRHHGYWC